MTYQTPRVVELGKPEDVVHGPELGGVDGIGPEGTADSTD
jgi:hypothetical protein